MTKETWGDDNARHKMAAEGRHFLHSYSIILCLHNQPARAVQGVQQFKASCQQMRPEGDKGLRLPAFFPLGLVSEGYLFPSLSIYWKLNDENATEFTKASSFKKKIKRVKNLYLSCSEVFLLKICFQWCDNKWLCCSSKSGQPLCKGGKNCFIKMHEERNDGL